MSQSELLNEKLKHLPDQPGIYMMKDGAGETLYVGKAKSLRSRVRSYFVPSADHSIKTRELLRRVVDLDTVVVETEADALILENNLIKEHRPRFNVRLKDDKAYPYIKITVQEAFPRVFVTRTITRDGAKYFGPYTDVRPMRQALELMKKLFTIRSCRYNLPKESPSRACLDYHIGLCKAPCIGEQNEAEYRAMIQDVMDVLKGKTLQVQKRLWDEMMAFSETMQFEQAAKVRDVYAHLRDLDARQRLESVGGGDMDVIGLARDGDRACGVILRIRDGKLIGREGHHLTNLDHETDTSLISAFVRQCYAQASVLGHRDVPKEILLPYDIEDREVIEHLLAAHYGNSIKTHVPQRGDKLHSVELANQNARHLLEEHKLVHRATEVRASDVLYELQEALELPMVPRTLVCFDISHTQGTETVAAAVFFENGEPNKAEYRKLKIKGDWGNDDFRSMHEAVTRYFKNRMEEEKKPLPDLVVIDGGKGQLSAAVRALDELELAQQPIVSLAKQEEEIFLPGSHESLRLPRRSEALKLLQRARDEAHRFSITYNRTLRSKRTIQSELSEIPGIGPRKMALLLQRFGSVRALKAAGLEEIADVPGIGRKTAQEILDYLNRAA